MCQVAHPDETRLPLGLMRHDATFHVSVFFKFRYLLQISDILLFKGQLCAIYRKLLLPLKVCIRTAKYAKYVNLHSIPVSTSDDSCHFFFVFVSSFLLFLVSFSNSLIHAATKHKHRPLEVCPFWATVAMQHGGSV